LPRAEGAGVATRCARAAAAVPEVLGRQRGEARARPVADANAGIEKDAASEPALATIELGVFVVREALVVAAAATEARHAEGGVMAMVDESAAPAAAMGGRARAERRIRNPCDRLLHAARARDRIHGHDDGVGAGALQGLEKPPHETARIGGVRVAAH